MLVPISTQNVKGGWSYSCCWWECPLSCWTATLRIPPHQLRWLGLVELQSHPSLQGYTWAVPAVESWWWGKPGFLLESQSWALFLQTMAILAELGPERLFAVLELEDEQVSLATYNLLQVMFDALKEGLQKDVHGKKEALVPGESFAICPSSPPLACRLCFFLLWSNTSTRIWIWNYSSSNSES